MNKSQIIELQGHVGTKQDGFWGPKSIAACKAHIRSLMPRRSPWPSSSQRSLRSFYGPPGDEDRIVSIDAPSWMRLYDSETKVKTIRCHELVATSLRLALIDAYSVAPDVVKRYFGCFVDRPVRNGIVPSVHAYGAAIDLDATRNRNRSHWPVHSTMPLGVLEVFAVHGWTSAAVFWSRDAMHFQATRP